MGIKRFRDAKQNAMEMAKGCTGIVSLEGGLQLQNSLPH